MPSEGKIGHSLSATGRRWERTRKNPKGDGFDCTPFSQNEPKGPGVAQALIEGEVEGRNEVRVHLVTEGKDIIPDSRFPVPAIEKVAPAEVTLFVLPGKDSWGTAASGAVLSAKIQGNEVKVSVEGKSDLMAPRDFGSTRYVILDGSDEVVGYGPLDGGKPESRTYKESDLAIPPFSHAFPLPSGLKPGIYKLLVGMTAALGGDLEETPLVAKVIAFQVSEPSTPGGVVAPDPGAP